MVRFIDIDGNVSITTKMGVSPHRRKPAKPRGSGGMPPRKIGSRSNFMQFYVEVHSNSISTLSRSVVATP